jgi:predicted small secreted protein
MKTSLLITTLLAGVVLTGCNKTTRTDTADTAATDTSATASASTATTPAATSTEPTIGQRVDAASARTGEAISDAGRSLQNAADRTAASMSRAGDKMSAEWNEWKLSSQDLDADLQAGRPIVRTRNIPAGAPTGAVNVNKSQIKDNVKSAVSQHAASIKDLDVEIDNETEVVLTGKAMSSDEVGKAIGSALSTEGVTKVTSKIKLDNK